MSELSVYNNQTSREIWIVRSSGTTLSLPSECIDFFHVQQQIAKSYGNQLVTQKWKVQHPQPLCDHFQSQGNCTGRLVGNNLSPNNCVLSQCECNHSQTGEGLQITATEFINAVCNHEHNSSPMGST